MMLGLSMLSLTKNNRARSIYSCSEKFITMVHSCILSVLLTLRQPVKVRKRFTN